MDDQGGRGDRRQDRPDVDPERRFECRPHHPRAGAHPLGHRELTYRADRRKATLGCSTTAPAGADGAAEFLGAGDLLHRRHVVLSQLGKGPRPQFGRVAVQDVPRWRPANETTVEDTRPRSLRPCGRKLDGRRTTLAHSEEGGISEADGINDGLDLGRSSSSKRLREDPTARPRPRRTSRRDKTWRAGQRRP